ncbi:M43 family zinc metalloprotease [Telluribacter humicola]|uniref:M43 family zinc metalloprotease n=1 Tax=Telluribacter humicola TaxID=1720261 RepID=UPI001A978170|nr:M43 family zinc metalloprotease [Telluribacter humicola]
MRNGNGRTRKGADEVIQIPVVVHVIHDQAETSIGGANNPNITAEQIKSQIEVLNEDYRRKPGTPGSNDDPLGTDTGIEFYLADYDPDGRVTDGITRTRYTTKTSFNPFTDDQLLADLVYWPSDKYLNIWVCRLSNNYLGIAQFPSVEGIPGLDDSNEEFTMTDGVIIDFRFFGRKTGAITSRIYNTGRTTTHEVGHWLGLIHTWGDVDCGTDYCDDTPPTKEPNQTTNCNDKFSNCTGVTTRNMIENYMDYSPDSCMHIFTKCQAERMRAVLAVSPRRARLVEYAKLGRLEPSERLVMELFPNPVSTQLQANIRFTDYQDITVTIYDTRGLIVEQTTYQDVWSRRINVDVRNYTPGIYYLKATVNNESVVNRFVVIR